MPTNSVFPNDDHPIIKRYITAIFEGFRILPPDEFMEFVMYMTDRDLTTPQDCCLIWIRDMKKTSLPNDEFAAYVFGGRAEHYREIRQELEAAGYRFVKQNYEDDYSWSVNKD